MPQYQGVWTLQAQSQAQSNQQWVTDPNFKNTTLLLQADGTGSGSQNQTFLDGSTNNFFITRNGNTTQGSFSPFSQAPGYWGNFFDGTGDYLTATSNAAYQFGTGDFTIECWLFTTAYNGVGAKIVQYADDGNFSGGGYGLEMTSTAIMTWSGTTITSTAPANQWFHVAIVRSSGTLVAYINGASVYSAANSTNYNYTGTYPFSVGAGRNGAGNYNNGYTGYISNLRVVKGTAVYTAAFTPQTTPFTAITNTSLLTCQSNYFVDNSTNAFAITANGTPSVQAFGPFAPALQWTPDVVGGSGYFDGTGDYLSFASNSNLIIGTGDFTLECWIYPTSWANSNAAIAQSNQGSSGPQWGKYGANNNLGFCNSGVAWIITDGTLPTVNMWSHVAVTRSGTTLKMYLNGAQTGSTATNSTNFSTALQNIGANGASEYFTGYISGFRMLKGTALYTGSTYTIPTAPLTAITNTQLLLNNTNAGIYDGKMGCVAETVSTAQVSTNPVKYGTGSIKFNGSTDRLTIKRSDLFDFGTGDFTIESWILFNSVSSIQAFATNYQNSTTGWGWQWRSDTGAWNFGYGDTGLISYTNTPVVGTWIHSAVSRSNNVLRMFVNGVLVSTVTNSTNMSGTTTDLTLGVNPFAGGVQYFNGYLDDFRITKGVGRYTATFTPPQQALPRQ